MPKESEASALLRAIVRQPSPGSPSVEQLAAGVRDWNALLELARQHGMVPMLFARLEQMGGTVPQDTQARLRADYHSSVFHNLANAAELIHLLKAFDQELIQAMPFKGVVLAASIYGSLTARPSGDLDLLVHRRDLTRATAVMLSEGYNLIYPVNSDDSLADDTHYECHFERPADGMVTELAWRISPQFSGQISRRDLRMDWVWTRRQNAIVAGAEVPSLDPVVTLLMLCMHGSKHMWSRMIWICDVAQSLSSSRDLNWEEILFEARRLGLWRPLALGVLLADLVAGAAVPQQVLWQFESDRTAMRLARHFEENLFNAPGTPPAGRVPYQTRLLGLRELAAWVFSLKVFRPNERDRAIISLPRSLDALYYLVRPIRLLRDRSAR